LFPCQLVLKWKVSQGIILSVREENSGFQNTAKVRLVFSGGGNLLLGGVDRLSTEKKEKMTYRHVAGNWKLGGKGRFWRMMKHD